MGGGRLREMVARGGSIVLDICYFQLTAVKKEYLLTRVT